MIDIPWTDVGYRLMVAMAGFSIGLSLMLAWGNFKDFYHGDRWAAFWGVARLGWALVIMILMPLIFQARNAHIPWDWNANLFLLALTLEIVGFCGISVERWRRLAKEKD